MQPPAQQLFAPDWDAGAARVRVGRMLREQPVASEMLIAFFASAAHSLSRAKLASPFPSHPCFARTAPPPGNDYELVERLLRSLPPIDELAASLPSMELVRLALLDWTLAPAGFSVTAVDPHEFAARTGYGATTPDTVLELVYDDAPASSSTAPLTPASSSPSLAASSFLTQSARFAQLKAEHGSQLAYHGSAVENWHGILRSGLDVRFCDEERVIFGKGIYLASDPNQAINFLTPGRSLTQSSLFDEFSCLAVAEIARHPEVHQVKKAATNMPETYFVVPANEFVRIKYLLQFRHSPAPPPATRQSQPWSLTYLLAAIMLLLLLCSFVRSSFWWRLNRHRLPLIGML